MADTIERLKQELTTGRIADIYAATYRTLIDRVEDTGLFPESLKEGYGHVQYNRSVGAVWALFARTGEFERFERVMRFTLESSKRCGLTRIPHVSRPPIRDENGNVTQSFSTDDQPDGAFHVINAWARFVLSGKASPELEEEYYEYITWMLRILLDQPYFYYNVNAEEGGADWPTSALRLVLNPAFEHSREGRRWQTYDILTQCFGGAALEAMQRVAEKRGDTANAAYWSRRLELLRQGVDAHMTKMVDGKRVYLEMLLPDGGWGKPFDGMGWPNLGTVAAQWQPLEPEVLDNTVALLRQKLWRPAPCTDGKFYLAESFTGQDSVNPDVFGKIIGWDIAYSVEKQDYAHILDWVDFISEVNRDDVLAECYHLQDGAWTYLDPGNGEQCLWWCWGMALVRESLGMPAAPDR